MTFGEAFAAARAAGLPDFEYNGKRFTTELAGEKAGPTKEERIQQAAQEYKDNYTNRSLADVEYRADLDPYISSMPNALLAYKDIEEETGGDVGQLIKHIMGSDDPNNPMIMAEDTITKEKSLTPMYDTNVLGLYSLKPEEILGRNFSTRNPPGVAYTSEFRSPSRKVVFTGSPLEVMAEELGHKGVSLLEVAEGKPRYDLNTEEALMRLLRMRNLSRSQDEFIEILKRANYSPEYISNALQILERLDKDSLKQLRERGRPSVLKTIKAPEESFLDKIKRIILGGEKPSDPLPRYAQGGIASIRKAA